VTNVLLAYLCVGMTLLAVYAINEWRSASHYRREHLQVREDELVYQDLLARLQLRTWRRPVIAGRREQEQRNGDADTDKQVAHGGSFPGWGRP